ncbi:MAG TPA: chemotaxis response regulator protein-glutamate methylesterase [Acidimicrobiales bacterium]|nr:chemotaxis response regulator protein-glutamate methylesterase [Acidimicrobiales bacterium]
MPPLRVLVVDDAVVMRRLVSQVLEEEPDMVVSTAANGRIALSKLSQVNPDAVVMDVEMPELDGLGALKELRKTHPDLPVIMFSTLTERGASATLDAMALGASDYVTKPANVGSVNESLERVRTELVPKIKALCGRRLGTAAAATPAVRPAPLPRPAPAVAAARSRCDLVAIGSSTGGPNALHDLLSRLPGTLAAPVVITQHMPPVFTRLLAERLDNVCQLTVREAHEGAVLKPGDVWIAPGDHHLVVRQAEGRVELALNQDPPENSCRPAVDVMFRSVCAVYGRRAMAVVLTGMGYDGQRGCEHLREAGATIVAQDEASSVVWGMPGAVARAGLADEVLPLADVAAAIEARVAMLRFTPRPSNPVPIRRLELT